MARISAAGSARLCSRMHNGRSRSSKVVDFGTNQKLVCNFLLVYIGLQLQHLQRLNRHSAESSQPTHTLAEICVPFSRCCSDNLLCVSYEMCLQRSSKLSSWIAVSDKTAGRGQKGVMGKERESERERE